MASRNGRIERLLGGEVTTVTVVPSKRGVSFEDQPLRQLLKPINGIKEKLRKVAQHDPGGAYERQKYSPRAFQVTSNVEDERILLVEDTWTSGATALSAAGSLIEAGATAVVTMPLARLVSETFWGEDHPYVKAMKQPWSLDPWPRDE